jgi:hypothetical protein
MRNHRGGKARPDLAQESSSHTERPPVETAPVETIQKIDFFSDEPLKKKRGGKARPDLAEVDGGGGGGSGGGGGTGSAGGAAAIASHVPVVVAAAANSKGGAGAGGGGEVKASTIDFDTPLPRKRGGKARSSSAA